MWTEKGRRHFRGPGPQAKEKGLFVARKEDMRQASPGSQGHVPRGPEQQKATQQSADCSGLGQATDSAGGQKRPISKHAHHTNEVSLTAAPTRRPSSGPSLLRQEASECSGLN